MADDPRVDAIAARTAQMCADLDTAIERLESTRDEIRTTRQELTRHREGLESLSAIDRGPAAGERDRIIAWLKHRVLARHVVQTGFVGPVTSQTGQELLAIASALAQLDHYLPQEQVDDHSRR